MHVEQPSSPNYVNGISSFSMNSLFLLSNFDTSPLYFDIHWGTNIGSKAGKNNVDW